MKSGIKPSRFCPKGHNKDVVGRGRRGRCVQCRREYERIDPSKDSRIHQFCPKGHDTSITGRKKDRECILCEKERIINQRIDPSKDSRVKPICSRGHDISVVGRDKRSKCIQCKKHPQPSKKHRTQFCPKEHDKDVVGRTKDGRCIECKKQRDREYQVNNKKSINEKTKERFSKRRLVDIQFKLTQYLRSRLHSAINGNFKSGSAVKDLGCSVEFFKTYIEDKFYGDMSWSNWGSYWELDHIKELCTFDLCNREEFLVACNYKNYQPLTIPDHLKKTIKEAKNRKNLS